MSIIYALPLDATTNISDLVNGGFIASTTGNLNGSQGRNYLSLGQYNGSITINLPVGNTPANFFLRQRMMLPFVIGQQAAIYFMSINNIPQFSIEFLMGTNSLSIYSGPASIFYQPSGGTLLGSVNSAFLTSTWQFVEIGAVIGSSGSVSIRLNSNPTPILTVTGNTQNDGTANGVAQIVTNQAGGGWIADYRLQDISINDNNITTLNPWNSWLGDTQVFVWPVINNGDTGFTPITNTNYQNVDNIPPNPAEYNYANSVGAQDTFDVIIAANSTISNVYCVAPVILAVKSDSGTRALTTILTSAGANVAGANVFLSTSPQYLSTYYGQDPNTNGNWSLANAAAARPGYNISV